MLSRLARILNSRLLLWAALAAPGVYYLQAYWREVLFYGEVVHASGILATRLLILTLAVTPLSLLMPRAAWVLWLKRRRRYFGVATFAYAFLHAAVYFVRQATLADVVEDALAAAMWTGWIALAVMAVLAATSNDSAVRWLRRGWKRLHRAVYVAAALTFAHWVLSAFDPVPGYIHLGVLAALEAIRVFKRPRRAAH